MYARCFSLPIEAMLFSKCLPEWINQTFMGQPSDIGEDRAMTNMILKQGKQVLFQRNSHVLTNVPETYTGLYKMFIRWGRSNVRENLMMAKFVFTNFRKESKAGARLLYINQFLSIVMAYPFLLFMLFFVAMHPICSSVLHLQDVDCLKLSGVILCKALQHLRICLGLYLQYSYILSDCFGLCPMPLQLQEKRGWLTRELS